jgi:hypothetical protein
MTGLMLLFSILIAGIVLYVILSMTSKNNVDDSTPPLEPTERVFAFDGSGYATVPPHSGYQSESFSLQVEIKTEITSGLVLFMQADDEDYLTIYLKDGKPTLEFDLGDGAVILESPETVNDGNWHTILAERTNQAGKLSIDGTEKVTKNSPGSSTVLSVASILYLGGLPTAVEPVSDSIVETPFKGCIQNLSFDGENLTNINLSAGGVITGCALGTPLSLVL